MNSSASPASPPASAGDGWPRAKSPSGSSSANWPPEFRPGEPWKGYPNIDPETDPYVTPGSVVNSLSVNTVRGVDHLRDGSSGTWAGGLAPGAFPRSGVGVPTERGCRFPTAARRGFRRQEVTVTGRVSAHAGLRGGVSGPAAAGPAGVPRPCGHVALQGTTTALHVSGLGVRAAVSHERLLSFLFLRSGFKGLWSAEAGWLSVSESDVSPASGPLRPGLLLVGPQ
ncbi:uncharacterized protein LOC111734785 [Pteropus vampyrus]|uniref:Uncharacterized protein LOC111734785 n=1 Tax=Pteropus vampyrus TaxID=132908 RepID=A0A6P6C5B4_PTEVA|nr:uncharacterized protein LOC111734785 [Pteropus vampyrus]